MSSTRRRGREYRPGQRPSWAGEVLASDDVVEVVAAVEEDGDEVVMGDIAGRKMASRAPRIQMRVEAAIEEDGDAVVHAPTICTDDLVVPEAMVELDEEEEAEERRRRARAKAAMAAAAEVESAAVAVEEESEEEVTDEESEEEEEEEDFGRPLMKPVFVSKSQRRTVDEREHSEQHERELQELQEKERLDRKREAREKLIDVLEREEQERQTTQADMPNDEDIENDEVELEKWRLREMVRLLREREERRLAAAEAADTEKRRKMTDAEIAAEAAAMGPVVEPKKKIKFLQKYHHKGVFYQDDSADKELLKRDYNVPTGLDAEIDRSALPKVLAVKNFGLMSRTKYTHLADQDTSSKNDPWAQDVTRLPRHHDRQRSQHDAPRSSHQTTASPMSSARQHRNSSREEHYDRRDDDNDRHRRRRSDVDDDARRRSDDDRSKKRPRS